uniref:Uncharacterized protein n=1 Tax=Dunaliella tertiolecta TaxID=3047 RepID=A0A7S3VMS0_DUNTE
MAEGAFLGLEICLRRLGQACSWLWVCCVGNGSHTSEMHERLLGSEGAGFSSDHLLQLPPLHPPCNPFVTRGQEEHGDLFDERVRHQPSVPEVPNAPLRPQLPASCSSSTSIEMKEVQPNPFLGVEYLASRAPSLQA